MSKYFLLFFLLSPITNLYAQCPTVNFTDPNNACINERVTLVNNSINGDTFYWDFCAEDLISTPTINSESGDIVGLSSSSGVKILEDNGNYYGFVVSRNNNKLFKLNYGNSLKNIPGVTDLGNLSGLLIFPEGIDILKFNGEWIGLIGYLNMSGGLTSLNFGNSLDNLPLASNIGSPTTARVRNLVLTIENNKIIAVLASYNSNSIIVVNYNQSLNDPVTPVDIHDTGALANVNLPIGFGIINKCDSWKAIITSYTTILKTVELDFGSSLLNTPTILGTHDIFSLNKPLRVKFLKQENDIYSVIANEGGPLTILNFGQLDGSPPIEISNTGLPQLNDLHLQNLEGSRFAIGIDFTTKLTSLEWKADCGQSDEYSNEFETSNLSYSSAGTHNIELTAINRTSGYSNTISKSVTITSSQAPIIDFNIGTNQCFTLPIAFTATADQPITSWNWDFGDGNNSTLQNPEHSYIASGIYDVVLNGVSQDGCPNTLLKQVQIFEDPTVSFTHNGGASICTFENIQFTNTTIIQGSNPSFLWDFGNGNTSAEENPIYAYTTAESFDVTLTVNEGGCGSFTIETITVNIGPIIDFSANSAYEGDEASFTNQSTGNFIASYLWDFGDGNTSTDNNPIHSYITFGIKTVQLTAITSNGCDNSISKPIEIIEKPNLYFSVKSSCSNETTTIDSLVYNSSSVGWDFCLGDYQTIAEQTDLTSLPSGTFKGIELVYGNDDQWYGFVLMSSKLYRLRFGTSLLNIPEIDDLDNLSGALLNPESIVIKQNSNNNWVAFIGHLDIGYGITRLNFGNDLSSPPTTENIGTLDPGRTRGMDLVENVGNYYLITTAYNSHKIAILNLGNSLENSFLPSDIFVYGTYSELNLPIGISATKKDGEWLVYVASQGNGNLTRFNFGADFTTAPVLENNFALILPSAKKLRIHREADTYYAIVGSDTDPISVWNLEELTSTSSATQINQPNLPIGFAYSVIDSASVKYLYTISSNNLSRYNFEAICSTSINYSIEEYPLIAYSQAGDYQIELVAFDENGNTEHITKTITISSSEAPQLNTQIIGNCLSSPINFNGEQLSGDITSWSWDFGDGSGTSNLQNDSYTYASTGEYQVKLSATNANGCNNYIIDTIQIYEEPIPEFSFTGGTNLCKGNLITFTNSSTGETGDIVTWNWDFNGEGTSSEKNPTFTFLTPGIKNITLTSSIPGCANVIQKTLTIIDAPTTSFSFSNTCNGQTNIFTDETTGSNLTSWSWNFGDGNTSIEQNPSHTFTTPGDYDVILTVTNNTGCFTTNQQTVVNHSIPVVNFTNDLPCSTSPIQFFDQSLVESTNIVAWEWDFGDGTNSNIQHPEHSFTQTGDFTVKLIAYSQFGCVDSSLTNLEIAQGPQVDFDWDKSCEGEATTFKDLTNSFGINITDWAWIVEGQLITNQNPTYTFNSTGIYSVQLSVTMDNFCAQTLTQDIIIELPPMVQFDYDEGCGSSGTEFYDFTNQTGDPIIAREWRANGAVFSNDSLAIAQLDPGYHTITLSVITIAGCEETTTTDITLIGSPVADFSINTDYGAAPLAVSFTNSSTGGNSFLWSFGEAEGDTSIETHPSFTFTEVGTYTVTLRTSSDSDCFEETSQLIEVVEPETKGTVVGITPIDDIDKTNFLLTIENNGTTMLDSDMSIIFRTDYGTEVIESFNEMIYAGKTINYQPAFALPVNSLAENLCIELFVNNDQLDRACLTLGNSIIISDPYPNPGNGLISVDVILKIESTIKIRVINRSGQPVITRSVEGVIGLNEIFLDGQRLPQGIYIIEITTGGKIEQFKTSIIR